MRPEPKYESRLLKDWMEAIHNGEILLPTFQRSYVWPEKHIETLIHTVLQNRTIGTLLIVKNDSVFPTRPLAAAENSRRNKPPNELLLDGQQRLTALWRALGGSVDKSKGSREKVWSVKVRDWVTEKELDDDDLGNVKISGVTHEDSSILDRTAPQAYSQCCFPLQILAHNGIPGNADQKLKKWCVKVFPNETEKAYSLERQIDRSFGERLRHYPIWFHSLPENTDKEEAIEVFLRSNKTSVLVSPFDIAVAHFDKGFKEDDEEKESGLRHRIWDHLTSEKNQPGTELLISQSDLKDTEKAIPRFGDHLLKLVCILRDKVPSNANIADDGTVDDLDRKFDDLVEALSWSAKFHKDEGFLSYRHLASKVPFRVLPALYLEAKKAAIQKHSEFICLCRAYLWRALLTERYQRSANTRLLEDARSLIESVKQNKCDVSQSQALIFDKRKYPIIDEKKLSDLDNPTSLSNKVTSVVGIRRNQAEDFATSQTYESYGKDWDYHHLYPKKYLRDNQITDDAVINHCLNSTMITKDTNNRIIKFKPPYEYLSDKSQLMKGRTLVCVRKAVESHSIPLTEITAKPTHNNVRKLYENFIKARAKLLVPRIENLCDGN